MTQFHAVAVVTGAGSGIGRQVALALLDAGYAVVLAGRRERALRQTASLAAGNRVLGSGGAGRAHRRDPARRGGPAARRDPPASGGWTSCSTTRARTPRPSPSRISPTRSGALWSASILRQGVPQADGSVAPEPTMDVEHVARTVVHMASLPLDANVQFVTIMATAMPLIGRG